MACLGVHDVRLSAVDGDSTVHHAHLVHGVHSGDSHADLQRLSPYISPLSWISIRIRTGSAS